ncbi:mitogen-activated protein kinase kinase kinase 3 [Eutrema salsugineum]|uniref:mitogen-activated protein kinase kinase kinase 3 n=1 Tax=Eutrema salsugineum TaxID=72664 RepID=UPI000CED0F12|nr:mitogen-activated protein kinase kinase kinase 3 [Eutrema salsugineum]
MSPNSWVFDETPLPRLGFLGQGTHGYVSLVRTPDGLLMAKKTSLRKYSEDLEKELRILHHFYATKFNTVRPTSPIIFNETMPVNVKVTSIYMEVAPHGSLKDMITKAENVLIFPSYAQGELCDLKLADFGLAKEPNGPDPAPGSLFEGTPEYLAPEAVGPRGRISSAIDIWSLGVMVLDMLGFTIVGEVCDCLPETLSPMARDFVRRCRVRTPTARATAEELMGHPFLTQSLEVPPLELLPVPSCLRNGVVEGRFF